MLSISSESLTLITSPSEVKSIKYVVLFSCSFLVKSESLITEMVNNSKQVDSGIQHARLLAKDATLLITLFVLLVVFKI